MVSASPIEPAAATALTVDPAWWTRSNRAVRTPEDARLARLANGMSFDELEAAMAASSLLVPPDPIRHHFTDGMYIRERHVAAGRLVTSRIHRTQHPYVLLTGKCDVWVDGDGTEQLLAPHAGITEAGTRRLLLAHQDLIWVTYHPNPDNETNLAIIEERLFLPHDAHLPKEAVCPAGQ